MKFYTMTQEYRDILIQQSLPPDDIPLCYGALFRSPDQRFIYLVPIHPFSRHDVKPGTSVPCSPAVMILNAADPPLGTLHFNEMVPVPLMALLPYRPSPDEQPLLLKQMDVVARHQKRIQKGMKRVHQQKKKGFSTAYLKDTLDFERLEQACLEWEERLMEQSEAPLPDGPAIPANDVSDRTGVYTLMHKDIPVLDLILDHRSVHIEDILHIHHPEHLPFDGIVNGYPDPEALSRWLRSRCIPAWRDELDEYLFLLDQPSAQKLLPIAYALSLSDCYWLKPHSSALTWETVNCYHNSFAWAEYEDLLREQRPIQAYALNPITPNHTTEGALAKTWTMDAAGQRVLLKKARPGQELEIYGERLASLICEALRISHVPYILPDPALPLCSCPAFTSDQREYVTAYSVLYPELAPSQPRPSSLELYEQYIARCQDHGLSTAAAEFARMVLVDFILMNTDRHLGNFGILRHPDTLEWISMAPVFDSGNTSALTDPCHQNDAPAARFFSSNRPFDEILVLVFVNFEEGPDWEAIIQAVETWEEEMRRPVLERIVDEQAYAEYVHAVYAQIEQAKQLFRRLQDVDSMAQNHEPSA